MPHASLTARAVNGASSALRVAPVAAPFPPFGMGTPFDEYRKAVNLRLRDAPIRLVLYSKQFQPGKTGPVSMQR
jgi:hypothetical protein